MYAIMGYYAMNCKDKLILESFYILALLGGQ